VRPGSARRFPVRAALGLYAALFGAAVLWRTALCGERLLYASEEAARAGLHPLRDLALNHDRYALKTMRVNELGKKRRCDVIG
jgi:hypothetical protein